MAKVYLGLGTNLGDKEANLRTAIYKLQERIGKLVSLSSFMKPLPGDSNLQIASSTQPFAWKPNSLLWNCCTPPRKSKKSWEERKNPSMVSTATA